MTQNRASIDPGLRAPAGQQGRKAAVRDLRYFFKGTAAQLACRRRSRQRRFRIGGTGGDPARVYLEKSFILRYGARTGRPLEKIMTTATSRYFALLALTAALWGAQPLLVKITMRELNPSTMTAVRYLLMSITFFALMRWRGLPLLPPLRLMPALLLMGITGVALNNIAQFTGLQLSTVSNATLIATTTPAVTALVALIFLRERLLPIELLGILLSVAGALFLVSKGQIDVLLHISFNKGDLLFFTAQLGWAVYSLTGFRVMRHLPPLTTTAWAGLFGTAGTFIYAALTGQLDVHSVGGTTLACMVYIVWIGGVCAMIFWNMGVKVVGAGQAAIFLNIMPLVGVVLGVTLLGEDFAFREAFGAVGILGGVYILTHSRQIMRRMDQRLIRRARELAAARRQAAEKESRRD